MRPYIVNLIFVVLAISVVCSAAILCLKPRVGRVSEPPPFERRGPYTVPPL